jgi:ketosteroid isomerase-like protein
MNKIAYLGIAVMALVPIANAGEVTDNIEARVTELMAAWNSGDHESVLAMYDEGFIFIPQEGEATKDLDQWRERITAGVIDYPNIKFKSQSLKVHGTHAYNVGMSSYDYKDEAGNVSRGETNYLLIWVKDDKGVWNIHLDIWWEKGPDSEEVAAEKAKITARETEMLKAWNGGDAESFTSFFDEGFLVVGTNSEPIGDRKAILKQWTQEVIDYPIMKYERTSLEVLGNHAYELGVNTFAWPALGEGATGKDDYLIVWKKDDDGVWNCHFEFYWESFSDE